MEAGKEFGILPAASARATRCASNPRWRSTDTTSPTTINAFEADLDAIVKLDKGDFVGRDALESVKAEGVKRKLVGLEMIDRGIARDGYAVVRRDGNEIGFVTSGSPAPFLKKNIALAYLAARASAPSAPTLQ